MSAAAMDVPRLAMDALNVAAGSTEPMDRAWLDGRILGLTQRIDEVCAC